MAIYEPRAMAGGGWRLALPQNGAGYIVLAALEPERDHDMVRATLVLFRDESTVTKDRVNLTRAQARKVFRERVEGEHHLTIPEAALVALEIACRETATVRHGPGAEPPPDDADQTATAQAAMAAGVSAPPLAQLLELIRTLLETYVVFPSRALAVTIALWIACTYVGDAFDVAPYLHLTSPEKRSGKTRVLELLERLVWRPWRIVQPSAATIFRKIHATHPTLLIDEVDTCFQGKVSESHEALRAVLDAGYRRGNTVPRCVGQQFERVQEFDVYGQKAFAGIRALPDTIADRGITLALTRRKRSEVLPRFRFRDVEAAAAPLRAQLAAWAGTARDGLRTALPAVPNLLHDRLAEVWEPLLAIADLAGGPWPQDARRAAVGLAIAGSEASEGLGGLLLDAIREIFAALPDRPVKSELFEQGKRLVTKQLLAALVEREAEPWGDWWGKEVDAVRKDGGTPRTASMRLARLLKPFGVQPRDIRTDDGDRKGYYEVDFADAFDRYGTPPTEQDQTADGASDPAPEAPDPADAPSPPSEVATPRQSLSPNGLRAAEGRDAPDTVGTSNDAETLAAQGASRRRDLERGSGALARCPRCGTGAGTPGPGVWDCRSCGPVPVLEREPGEDDGDDYEVSAETPPGDPQTRYADLTDAERAQLAADAAAGDPLAIHALASVEAESNREVAHKVMAWVARTKPARFSARDVLRALGQRVVSTMTDLQRCLEQLVEAGLLLKVPQPERTGGGRPASQVYEPIWGFSKTPPEGFAEACSTIDRHPSVAPNNGTDPGSGPTPQGLTAASADPEDDDEVI
jgi:hypothetical protein